MSSFFQRLLGGAAAQPGPLQAGGGAAAVPDVAPHDLLDVRFDESDRGEAELAQLFDGYERALRFDREVADEMLLAFFDRFATACAAWVPTPAAMEATRAAAAAEAGGGKGGNGSGSGPRRAQVCTVTGCSGGHPRALLAAAVEGLERATKALSAAVAAAAPAAGASPADEAVAVAGDETAASAAVPSPPASPAQQQEQALLHAAGLPLLRALRVLLRSQHNRAVLCSLGLLTTLCQLVRMLAQKLQAVASVLAVVGSSSNEGGASSSTISSSTSPGGRNGGDRKSVV